jgi:hypothetical protein
MRLSPKLRRMKIELGFINKQIKMGTVSRHTDPEVYKRRTELIELIRTEELRCLMGTYE